MSSLAATGQTIILVSHNMDVIPRLCSRAILMDAGSVAEDGRSDTVIERHLASLISQRTNHDIFERQRPGDGSIRFTKVRLLKPDGRPCSAHVSGDDLILEIILQSEKDVLDAELAVSIKTISGTRIVSSWTRELNWSTQLRSGQQTFTCRFKNLKLRPGHTFQVVLWAGSFGMMADLVETALTFSVVASATTRQMSTDKHQGVILGESSWSRHDGD
jgi:lipopolysaccharide transport system ATP-binding protein